MTGEFVRETPLPEVPAGDSAIQRQAETAALKKLSEQLGVQFAPERIVLSSDKSNSYIDVDGVSRNPPMLVEVWAHQGTPKPAQRHKVLADAFKLTYAGAVLGSDYRRLLCFTDDEAAKPFRGRSWYAAGLTHHGIEVVVVSLSEEWRRKVLAAQARQYR